MVFWKNRWPFYPTPRLFFGWLNYKYCQKLFRVEKTTTFGALHQTVGRSSIFCKKNPKKGGKLEKNFFWVSGCSFGCFWIVLRFWPKIFMKNACFLPKQAKGWNLGGFRKFHKIIKIGHFLIMKKFFESGFLMSYWGLFPPGVKIHKSKKVYHKCVVAQRLWLLK